MATTFITRTPSSNGSETKSTLSMWFKRSNLGSQQTLYYSTSDNTNNKMIIRFNADDTFDVRNKVGGSFPLDIETNRKFRDTSAWYHFVLKFDTTQATSSDRFKMYVNGVQETSFSTETYPSQNANLSMNQTNDQLWVGAEYGSGSYFDGLITHAHWTDGYAYDASTFGETDSTSGIWKPKTAPSVTYGTNGFFLKFENSGNMDLDSSGNNLSFTTSGTLIQTIDTPSNVFPNISKAMQPTLASNATISNGGLTSTSSSSDYTILCSMAAKKGKWYWEVKMGNASNNRTVGVVRMDKLYEDSSLGGFYPGGNNNSTNYTSAYSGSGGFIETNTAGTRVQVTSGVNNTASSDIVGLYLDLDNYTLKFYRNNTLENQAALNATWVEDFVAPCARADHNQIMHFNFGSGFFGTTAVSSANADANGFGAFEYSPTLSGVNYYAWCTKNIKEFG